MSLKTAIAPLVHSLALTAGVSATRAKALRVGRILAFHGIGDPSYSTATFESHLRWLADNFTIVSLDTMLQRLPAGLSNEVVLTFDDGLRNNFTQAYPLLKKFNAPATFFIVSGLVGSSRWLWTHETRARLAALPSVHRGELSVSGSAETDEQILEQLKQLPLKERSEMEDRLRHLTPDFSPSSAQKHSYDLMSWNELQQLDPALITIGSHSLTHPILSHLSDGELTAELRESRRLLENKLQRTVEFFCYPNGSHNPEVVRLARTEYRAAVGTDADFVRSGCDLHQLPRIGTAPGLASLAWRMHRPGA